MAKITQIFYQAIGAARLSCHTHIPAMQDQPVVRIQQVIFRHETQQRLLDSQHSFAWRKTRAIGNSVYMSVNCHGGLTKSSIENNICGLASNPGQGLELLACARNLPIVFFAQDTAGLDNVFGFCVEQSYGAYIRY